MQRAAHWKLLKWIQHSASFESSQLQQEAENVRFGRNESIAILLVVPQSQSKSQGTDKATVSVVQSSFGGFPLRRRNFKAYHPAPVSH